MDEGKALAIVSALANGVNPLTGEVFATDSPYQSPDVVRALYLAMRALETVGRRRSRAVAELPGNAGKPWTDEEDRRLLAEFDAGRTPVEIAQLHARTLAGIQARLERHGRLQPQLGVRSSYRRAIYGRATGGITADAN
jgi:hypothetical protein